MNQSAPSKVKISLKIVFIKIIKNFRSYLKKFNKIRLLNEAVIPARKNSKRILNKNIKIFKGFPLIYWSIKAAKDSKVFDKIFVSTNCKKISELSMRYGAEVP